MILCNRNGETEKRGSQCKCSSWLSHHCVHLLDQSCWDLLRSRVNHASELNTSGTKREHLFPRSHSLLVRVAHGMLTPLHFQVAHYRNTGWIPTSFPGNRVRKPHGRRLKVCGVTEGGHTSTKLVVIGRTGVKCGPGGYEEEYTLSISISTIGLLLIFTFKNWLDFSLSIFVIGIFTM